MLDVGCGRGVAVKHLRQQGIDCVGVELARPRPLAGVEEHLHLGTDVAAIPCELRRRVEVVLLLDVLEHLPDAVGFMRSVASAVERLTTVIVTVPARPEVWSNYDEFYGHLRRYTLPMIDDVARELGWTIPRRRYVFRITYPPARLLAALGRPRALEVKAPRGAGIGVHRLLSDFTMLEHAVLPGSWPGTSILATFEVPGRP